MLNSATQSLLSVTDPPIFRASRGAADPAALSALSAEKSILRTDAAGDGTNEEPERDKDGRWLLEGERGTKLLSEGQALAEFGSGTSGV
jgi:hypothetical protein